MGKGSSWSLKELWLSWWVAKKRTKAIYVGSLRSKPVRRNFIIFFRSSLVSSQQYGLSYGFLDKEPPARSFFFHSLWTSLFRCSKFHRGWPAMRWGIIAYWKYLAFSSSKFSLGHVLILRASHISVFWQGSHSLRSTLSLKCNVLYFSCSDHFSLTADV